MSKSKSTHVRRNVQATLVIVAMLGACGGSARPPAAGESLGGIPDLRGQAVMVFPVQSIRGLGAALDPVAEVSFALEQRAAGIRWILPPEIRRAVQGTPGLDLMADGLPVGEFLRVEVRRVGDPLYGYLRRMAAITGSDVALIPVEARYRPGAEGAAPAIELAATLLNARTGRVYWFGVVEGTGSGPGDPGALAGAAEALARTLTPLARAGENDLSGEGAIE
jgi:hypothetical protein